MAEHIARLKGDLTLCGKNWLKKFKKRNLTIQVAIRRRIDAKRVNQAADKEVISAFFELVRKISEEKTIKLENMWNFDEYGTAIGASENTTVLAETARVIRGGTHVKIAENRE